MNLKEKEDMHEGGEEQNDLQEYSDEQMIWNQ